MRKRFYHLGLLIGTLAAAKLACALPPPNSLLAREKRNVAKTSPTPTPTPTPAVIYVPATAQRSDAGPQANRPSTIVVVDAGHGGFDRGGIPGQSVAEKTMTLDVAQRLKAVLAAYGYRVVMTRDSDVFVPLGTRVAIANSYRNAIFICIHFNAAPRGSANGVETYFYSSQSLPLASAIHYYVAGGAPTPNRGVRRRGYFVLRRTTIPAVLVECGFLTNPTEAQYALSALYRQKLAEEIARGIRNRSSVVRASARIQIAANTETVPLQPFIDQTHVRDPDISRSRHSSKKTSRSKSSTKKKSAKKQSSESDDSGSKPRKKKSAPKQTED